MHGMGWLLGPVRGEGKACRECGHLIYSGVLAWRPRRPRASTGVKVSDRICERCAKKF